MAGGLFLLLFMAFSNQDDKKEWNVPDEYKNLENPTLDDDDAMVDGKMLYMKHCNMCHGKSGLGDGVMGRRLEDFNVDFTSEEFFSQSDGEKFYKAKFGRDLMPSYEKLMSDEDIWYVLTYIRSFKD